MKILEKIQKRLLKKTQQKIYWVIQENETQDDCSTINYLNENDNLLKSICLYPPVKELDDKQLHQIKKQANTIIKSK